MPTISPVQSTEVQAAISRAAARTGVDFDYLLAQAKLESGLDPSAEAKTSSATGLYQFIESTWLRTLDRHGSKHGLDWADAAINANGQVASPAARNHILSLRYDADTSSLMAAELARDNAAGLRTTLGREPQPAELYLAHFLGLGGAQKFLGALENNPDQSAVALMPRAARANKPIFYSGGSPRSVGQVMALMQDKVEAAYGSTPMPGNNQPISGPSGNIAPQSIIRPADAAPQDKPSVQAQQQPYFRTAPASRTGFVPPSFPSTSGSQASMADTLRSTFGNDTAGQGRASDHIAAAYSKFKAFGL